MLALLLLAGGTAGAAPPAGERIALAQLIIRERVAVRVQARPAPAKATEWKTRRAPRCMPIGGVAGAAFLTPDSIDLIVRGGSRIRAELESSCPAIDYYEGFYVVPAADGQICAGRDAIHARSGGECQIRRFRKLVPKE